MHPCPLKLVNKWINFGGRRFFHGLPLAAIKRKKQKQIGKNTQHNI